MNSQHSYTANFWNFKDRSKLFDITCPKTMKRLSCVICKDILVEPCLCQCGCRYCYSCVKDHTSYNELKCPECCQTNEIIRDEALEDELLELEIICPYEKCESKCKLKGLSDHLRICEHTVSVECDMRGFGCTKMLLRVDMEGHMRNDVCSHMGLMVVQLGRLKTENEEIRAASLDSERKMRLEIDSLKSIIEDFSSQIKILKENLVAIECKYQSLSQENRFGNITLYFPKVHARSLQAKLENRVVTCLLKYEGNISGRALRFILRINPANNSLSLSMKLESVNIIDPSNFCNKIITINWMGIDTDDDEGCSYHLSGIENVPFGKEKLTMKMMDFPRNYEIGDKLRFNLEIYDLPEHETILA